MNKFGIGKPAPRPEDPRFVTGHGRFVEPAGYASLTRPRDAATSKGVIAKIARIART